MKIPDNFIVNGKGNVNGKEIEKQFFVNMTSDSKKIHKTNSQGCPNSLSAYKYIEFDSIQEARDFFKKYNKDISVCEHCFK